MPCGRLVRMNRNLRFPARLLLSLLASSLLAGCGGGSKKTTQPVISPDPLPAGTVLNDSPGNTALRFKATFEYQSHQSYAALIAADFHFGFSAETDPSLVAQYGDTWGAQDESLAVAHLFNGFTSTSSGTYIPGASDVTVALNAMSEFGDSTHVDSMSVYRVIRVGNMIGAITIPDGSGGILYTPGGEQRLFLVRGDAAVLRPGQPAATTRWYIRRWEDHATVFPAARIGPVTNPARGTTWGAVKNQYRS